MQEPEEILDVGHEQVVSRVASVDVAKASGMVCTRVPHPIIADRRITKVWQVSTTTNAILELVDHLAGLNVERVVVESTSDYGRPFVYLLEAVGVPVWLVNAHDVKNVPGRPKTDKLDLGEAATAAAKTNTFLGARYQRLVKRRGKLKALVAVARSILVTIWHLLNDPASRYHDLGASYHKDRLSIQRCTRSHVQQLRALGYQVTLTTAS